MKLPVFSIVFLLLIVAGIYAAGIEISEIDVRADYDEAYTYRVENKDRKDFDSVPVGNNTRIDVDVLPGSNVTFTIRVENTFQGDELKIKGTTATITIEEIDDGADLEQESLDFELEPGDDFRDDVKFQIPIDVEAGTYSTIIEAEGEDRNGTSYSTKVNLKLEVKKQSHDIRITKVLLNPSVIDCDRKATLTAEITNAGSNPENQMALEFKATALGVNSYDKDIFLESSDEASEEEKTYTKTLNIEAPSFFQAGKFPILINLYWKNFVLFDQKTADLVVKDCAAGATKKQTNKEAPKQETKKPEVTVIQPKEEAKEPSNDAVITTTEISVLNSPILLSMLLGGLVIAILAGLIAFGYWKRSKV